MRRHISIFALISLTMGAKAQKRQANDPHPVFNEVCVANIDQTIDHANQYGSWVELYNPSDSPIPLEGWYISDDARQLSKHRLTGYGELSPGGYLCVFFGHHAADGVYGPNAGKQVRFKLNGEGGSLFLSPDGKDVSQTLTYPNARVRCSYARTGMAGNEWQHCGQPTPGAPNTGHFASEMLPAPRVNCDSRLFTQPFTIQIEIPSGSILRYTTDGSTPTHHHGQTCSSGLFEITRTTTLRLRCFAENYLPSPVVTRTYIHKNKDYYLPIVAISTDPRNLYDDYIGCYVQGKNGIEGRGSDKKSNLNMDWERPVNFEYLTADGRMVINQETSFEVVGGYSRHFNPASFKVQAKKQYGGSSHFNFPIFAHKPYNEYKQLFIRNGGNNNRTYGGPRIQDAITQQVLTSSGYYVDAQEYQPAHLFINGQYVAMMNVREPNNRFHGCANYGYDNDNVDGFEYSGGVYAQKGGSREAFDQLISISKYADLDNGYREVAKLLDIEEFVRYMAAICYTGSYDWLLNGNNVKGYRTQDDGKFHLVFFDQDLSWKNTNNVEAIDGVTTNEVLALYNNLKQNPIFRKQFVTSYCLLHGSVYTPERCQHIADSICALVKNALALDYRYTTDTYQLMRIQMWGRAFREARMKSLQNAYGLPDGIEVKLYANIPFARIQLEGQAMPLNTFAGTLFGPTSVSVQAPEGYRFSGWKNEQNQWVSHENTYLVTTAGTYTAVYEERMSENVSPICINEVSAANSIYVSEYSKRSDWIEIYNRGTETIDLAGMFFSDEETLPTKYRLEAANGVSTMLRPNRHVIIWCDGKPSMSQLHLPFKLKNEDQRFLSVQSADGRWKDTIRYDRHSTKETVGRYPDGGGGFCTFYRPTIAASNQTTYYDFNASNLNNGMEKSHPFESSKQVADITYYNIQGQRISSPHRQRVVIQRIVYTDGTLSSRKILNPGACSQAPSRDIYIRENQRCK